MSVPTAIMSVARLGLRARQRFRITEPEIILSIIWQDQEGGEAGDNAPDILADKLRDYLMGNREPLVFYEVAVRQVAN